MIQENIVVINTNLKGNIVVPFHVFHRNERVRGLSNKSRKGKQLPKQSQILLPAFPFRRSHSFVVLKIKLILILLASHFTFLDCLARHYTEHSRQKAIKTLTLYPAMIVLLCVCGQCPVAVPAI